MTHPHRWLPALAGGLLLTTPVLAQVDAAAPAQDSVKAAKELLEKVGKTYAKAPALTEAMSLSFVMPDMPAQTMTYELRSDKNNTAIEGMLDMLNLYIVDGVFYVTADMAAGNAVKAELGDDPAEAISKALGPQLGGFCPPSFAWRASGGEADVTEYLGLTLLQDIKIAGHSMTKSDKGVDLHKVMLTGSNEGSAELLIDAETLFLEQLSVSGLPEGMSGAPIVATLEFDTKSHARLEDDIVFDVDGLEFHSDFDTLMAAGMAGGAPQDLNPSVELGAEAPSFSLVDHNGKEHSLSNYRGRIVMLDWWGIW